MTERAALAGARWLGRGDVKGAEESAATAMREGLDELPFTGRIVVGGDEETDALAIGRHRRQRRARRPTSRSTRSRVAPSSRAGTTGPCR